MKIILAPNTFKESLPAEQVCAAMERGIRAVTDQAQCISIPMADGGDGTAEALVAARQGTWVELTANDPLMRPVPVRYGLIDEGKTAVMEMAEVSGLRRLQEAEKNPQKTTTFGTGEIIRNALDRGVENIVIGIGGSATTDAGIGMAAALGYRFLDAMGKDVQPIGGEMNRIQRIDASRMHPRLNQVKIGVACDVTNPLLGPQGAAPVYGPQKGATPEMVKQLEAGLAQVAQCWRGDLGQDLEDMPGGGAAGGLGAGLAAFCGAELRSGFELVAEYAQLDRVLEGADLAFTGEGKIDGQTAFGKVPAGVGRHAQKLGIPVVALGGCIAPDAAALLDVGITALFSIVPSPMTLSESMSCTSELVERTTEQVMRLFLCK